MFRLLSQAIEELQGEGYCDRKYIGSNVNESDISDLQDGDCHAGYDSNSPITDCKDDIFQCVEPM